MTKVRSLADLKKLKEEVQSKIKLREKGDHPENLIQIKVSMATCGIASGAKETMNFMIEELDHQGIDALVTQTGCMGFCYAEPTIELTMPGKQPVIYGYVDKQKAQEIIDRHIKMNELVDGIIPVNYKTIDD
ncbi:(2Fe-2S) ferredoxin domain-containing protein [Sunxiuqinia elliptica]|uniref:NAD(P)-dependent iron-only hydrogenase iron-sulfur protein n=1 Tax=Sunxiuqinia elliptica TaxID=655355 RepID=A0A1I2L5T9_9BACT|nr:(2Fe-2S) ferredoxin domain-containing protein [Sunxiuqinia elliptica]TDN96692.1 NAD(P)-dependent iron-only hydrogenase iron-sulfur protein [Sunxiuqinia elliptica]TDO55749.1 NAD(P)-dependent iron-only hydrogenase iron-sulfur protein [Sunxiuqinia elliptica]SFF72817.1 NADP-reducing hydrogenase subunit HndB [Sunxiuqinia elliptica]